MKGLPGSAIHMAQFGGGFRNIKLYSVALLAGPSNIAGHKRGHPKIAIGRIGLTKSEIEPPTYGINVDGVAVSLVDTTSLREASCWGSGGKPSPGGLGPSEPS